MDLKLLLEQMTIDEKIGQLAQYNAVLFIDSEAEVTGPLLSKKGLTEEDIYRVGSILNFKNAEEMRQIQDMHLKGDRHKIPIVFMMDVIHGYKTIYPIPLALGCSFDTELVEECSRMAAEEASACGVHVTFTPMVDYARDARWGRVMETCGEEPLLNGLMGEAQIKAFHGEDLSKCGTLATCVKHFAAYGAAEAGRDYNLVELSEHTLREFYFPAYKKCIDAGVDMVMTSFNSLNGVPACANEWLTKEILKDEWGFDGIIVTDMNAIAELIGHGVCKDLKDAAEISFKCGCHLDMSSSGYVKHLKELIDEKVVTVEQLDCAVMKILEFKKKLGLFEDPYRGASTEAAEKVCLTKENRTIARKAAVESAVLLKNNGVLPFSENIKKIAIIGPFADNHAINGFWSCCGSDEDTVTVKQGIEALLPEAEVVAVNGCGNLWNDYDKSGFEEAIATAKWADAVILCLGEPQNYSGEGNSRTDIDLTGVQNELAEEIIKVNSNTAVVLFTGRPLAIKRLDSIAPAILNMWFPGTEGGSAAALLLFGKANPAGKLTMTFPQSVGQCPIYYNHPNTGRPKRGDDNIHYIYTSNYIDCGNLPLYSFGYGLSYSNFVYEDMTVDKKEFTDKDTVRVSVTVYNDSGVSGSETVQLYMRDLVASNVRPVCQLIDFRKISLAAGERKTVEFTVTESMLRYWNNENQFVSDAGDFIISVGYADHMVKTERITLI